MKILLVNLCTLLSYVYNVILCHQALILIHVRWVSYFFLKTMAGHHLETGKLDFLCREFDFLDGEKGRVPLKTTLMPR